MQDFKNVIKVFGVLLFFFSYFIFICRPWETKEDVMKRILDEEIPKSYDFKVISCKEYRGFIFQGVNVAGDTVCDTLSFFWSLERKCCKGDRILKEKGAKELFLIKNSKDTVKVHLFYGADDLTIESEVNEKLQ